MCVCATLSMRSALTFLVWRETGSGPRKAMAAGGERVEQGGDGVSGETMQRVGRREGYNDGTPGIETNKPGHEQACTEATKERQAKPL